MSSKIQLTQHYVQIKATPDDASFQALLACCNIFKMRAANTYRCSLHLLATVLEYLRPELDLVTSDSPVCVAALQEQSRIKTTTLLKKEGTDEQLNSLWAHQAMGVALSRLNKRYNFFYETRTGKTRMAYQIMLEKLKAGDVKRCLVVTKATIIQSWLTDAKEFPELKVNAYYGSDKQRRQALSTPCHILIWSSAMLANNLDKLKKMGFDLVVFDESSALKDPSSKISEAAIDYSMTVEYWYNLSATPAPNGKHEYYVQMMTVAPYIFDHRITYFKKQYFENTSRDNRYEALVIYPHKEKEFMDLVELYSIYVDHSVMPVAKKEWYEIEFELDESTAAVYTTMKNKFLADVEAGRVVADSNVAVRAKLSQITSGFIMDTEAIQENLNNKKLGMSLPILQEIHQIGENRRINALQALLKYIGDTPVVIWANYRQEFEDIRHLLNSRAKYLNGASTLQEKETAIFEFKAKRLQYLVCHPKSLGMGINLTEAHNCVYYSVTDSYEDFKQSSERIFGHITVQPNDCIYYVLSATIKNKPTVDTLSYNNVMNKRDASTDFLNYLKAGALE